MKKIMIIITMFAIAFINVSANFSDLDGHWAEKIILGLASEKRIDGYPDGTYKPDEAIKRDQFIKMLVTLENPKVKLENVSSYWAQKYIDVAIKHKYLEEGMFENYEMNISRDDAAKLIFEYLDIEEKYSYRLEIKDEDQISNIKEVKTLMWYNIILGYEDDAFKPQENLTRAESCIIMNRIISFLEETQFNSVFKAIGGGMSGSAVIDMMWDIESGKLKDVNINDENDIKISVMLYRSLAENLIDETNIKKISEYLGNKNIENEYFIKTKKVNENGEYVSLTFTEMK